jgi:hypothetical protein
MAQQHPVLPLLDVNLLFLLVPHFLLLLPVPMSAFHRKKPHPIGFDSESEESKQNLKATMVVHRPVVERRRLFGIRPTILSDNDSSRMVSLTALTKYNNTTSYQIRRQRQ